MQPPSDAEADLRARVVSAIEDHGPISFAEYMEIALYARGGFYDAPPVGTAGHFVTSPHIHPLFGELLARGLRGLWERLDRPEPFRVVEAGAGDGTLARHLHTFLGAPLEYTAVERSAGARARLQELGLRTVTDLLSMDPLEPGVVIANELLDNLPFRRVRGTREGPVEVRIGIEAERLVEIDVPLEEELETDLATGDDLAVPIGALEFVDSLAEVLHDGYALLIDYEGGRNDLHGYRAQHVVEIDVDAPGTTDITAGVDLAAVAAHAEALNLHAFPAVSQTDALRALGFEEWFTQARDRQTELLTGGSGADAVRAWSGRNTAMELVDPIGLGRLRWLTLATRDRGAPPWNPA
ncbi:MAG TPA: SAM-dependent methyltransferase [Actinomycetota bacterium]|jgi:SAM-dependent MidA family methyltransferase